MHSPLLSTAFPDFRETTADGRTQIRCRVQKRGHTSSVELDRSLLLANTPAWRSVAVKTDSSGGRSLKFISASQGGGILDSSTGPLTAWRAFAFFLALGFSEHEINTGKHDVSFREKDLKVPRPKPQEGDIRALSLALASQFGRTCVRRRTLHRLRVGGRNAQQGIMSSNSI